jgi:type 1 glutamine amidotransferase
MSRSESAGLPRQAPLRLLIFTKTTGYRHDSIPAGALALRELSRALGIEAEATEDAACFEPQRLARFGAVAWLSTSGNVLGLEQRRAFQAFVQGGGGYLGIHAASASEDDWPWYAELVGARFTHHPEPQPARLIVEDREHPATAHLGPEWVRSDEWYEFDDNPRPRVRVLISVDESSYRGGTMGDHPLVWCRKLGAGRSFYTALGHDAAHYQEPALRAHLAGALRWVLAGRSMLQSPPEGERLLVSARQRSRHPSA